MADITEEESNSVYKFVLGLAQRLAVLETKQLMYTEDRQRLTKLETTYTKDRQQMFEFFGHITETIKQQMEIKKENFLLNSSLVEVKIEQTEMKRNMQEMRIQQDEKKHNFEEMRIEKQEMYQTMNEMRMEQDEIKHSLEEMRRGQQEVKQNLEKMRSEQDELKLNLEAMRTDKQEMNQTMDEMRREQGEIKHSLEEMRREQQEVKQNMEEIRSHKDELKHNLENIIEIHNKSKALSDIAQRVQYDVDNDNIINQQQNNLSSIVKAIDKDIKNESAYQQKDETDTNQVILLSDIQSKFSNLNQSLKDIQQMIQIFHTDVSRLQSQYNEHYIDSSTLIEIRNKIKQIDLACERNVQEIDEKQGRVLLHIKLEFKNLKNGLERSNQRIKALDSDFSRLQRKFIENRCSGGGIRFNPKCYYFSDTTLSWNQAKKFCIDINANLVSVSSRAENNILVFHAKQKAYSEGIWLDGTDQVQEGIWIWNTTGYPFTFTNWNKGQPDDANGNEDCASLKRSMNYNWNDAPCHFVYQFICEKNI